VTGWLVTREERDEDGDGDQQYPPQPMQAFDPTTTGNLQPGSDFPPPDEADHPHPPPQNPHFIIAQPFNFSSIQSRVEATQETLRGLAVDDFKGSTFAIECPHFALGDIKPPSGQ
jgi:hypothetical protein